MLQIEYTVKGVTECILWVQGEPIPEILSSAKINKISASGCELSFIEQVFPNIPTRLYPKDYLVVWRGEFARFIIDNL